MRKSHELVVNRFIGPAPAREVTICRNESNTVRGPYSLTDSSLRRIERVATSKVTNRYDGEGRTYCISTVYRFE